MPKKIHQDPHRFSDKNTPLKRRLRRLHVEHILYRLSDREQQIGARIISLTNVNLRAIWREFGSLVGTTEHITAAEKSPEVYQRIRVARHELPSAQRDRTHLHGRAEDYFRVAQDDLIENTPEVLVLDMDFCSTWGVERETSLTAIQKLISLASRLGTKRVFAMLTRSRRDRYGTTDETVAKDFAQLGFKLIHSDNYQDSAMMASYLFEGDLTTAVKVAKAAPKPASKPTKVSEEKDQAERRVRLLELLKTRSRVELANLIGLKHLKNDECKRVVISKMLRSFRKIQDSTWLVMQNLSPKGST